MLGRVVHARGLARLPVVIESIRSAGLAVELRQEGEPARLPAGEDVSAYRIVQESLTNTLKHARAKRASVTLFGGTLTAGPRREGGFRVHARLPRPR